MRRRAQTLRGRELRNSMSKVEQRLWYRLRYELGHKFRRQVPIGPHFADFAALAARLVVEVDGDVHFMDPAYDRRRDVFMAALGYRVPRFTAPDVDERLDAVVEEIAAALAATP